MPLVYDRIMDKVVFKAAFSWFSQVLHPSQSLVDVIKEAQYNFCEAQRLLRAHVNRLAATLLIDLSKAFERVNLNWLLFLLRRYRAPEWLYNYFAWTFSSRTTISKITGCLVSRFEPLVGLDMGRACSVLLFCLSVDPMFWSLHCHHLTVQRAYMDDTTLASTGLSWVAPAQNTFQQYQYLGIVVDTHPCCQFHSIEGEPLGAASSWRLAAVTALQTTHQAFIIIGMQHQFSRQHLQDICAEQIPRSGLVLLARLCAMKCTCKNNSCSLNTAFLGAPSSA